jgi:hypothetical protein
VKANYTLVKMQSKEKADCSVLAAQFALNLSYERAYGLLELAGRKPRQGVYGPTFEKLGLQQRPDLSCMTVGRAMESMQSGRFVVFVSGHFFAVVDGRMFNNQFTKFESRVRMVYEVPLDSEDFQARYPHLAELVRIDKLPDMRGINCR